MIRKKYLQWIKCWLVGEKNQERNRKGTTELNILDRRRIKEQTTGMGLIIISFKYQERKEKQSRIHSILVWLHSSFVCLIKSLIDWIRKQTKINQKLHIFVYHSLLIKWIDWLTLSVVCLFVCLFARALKEQYLSITGKHHISEIIAIRRVTLARLLHQKEHNFPPVMLFNLATKGFGSLLFRRVARPPLALNARNLVSMPTFHFSEEEPP